MRRISLALLLSLLFAACHFNPVTNRPQIMLTSRRAENALGDQHARQVEATMGLVAEPRLNAYIAAVGERLIRQAPAEGFDFHFRVVDMEEPNAFALPGGHIFLSRGILMLANSEDELAGVIAHEIAHVLGRDAGSRISLGAPVTLAAGIGAAATGIVSPYLGDLVGGIGGLTEGLLLSPYSRQQERNADAFGLRLAAAAGWEPHGLSNLLHALERHESLQGETSRAMSFFASHPGTPERVAETRRKADVVEPAAVPPIAARHADFLAVIDGLVVGNDPRAGFFDGPLFVQPELGFSIRFPDGWETHNQPDRVIAAAPDGEAMAILTLAGEGDDPMVIAAKLADNAGIDRAQLDKVEIHGLPAVHSGVLSGRDGRRSTAIHASWIALHGNVYQVTCATTPNRAPRLRTEYARIPNSFRPLASADLVRVRVQRLRIHRSKRGETVTDLLKRVGSSWDGETAAIANGVEANMVLPAGTLFKAAVEEAFAPRPRQR